MSKISVVLPVCNHEKHVHDAVKSVLNQSFKDFEVILIDYGSTDDTLSVVRAFSDERVRIVTRNDLQNRIQALNTGLRSASGKYVAIMEADHLMHVDRLKIQHAVMEAELSITVCASCVKQSGNPAQGKVPPQVGGLLENPLLTFLRGNDIIHPTVMIRKSFLTKCRLRYEDCSDAEDFKLWTEVAKRGGQFYVDTQTLLYRHAKNKREDGQKQRSSEKIIHEIVEFLAKDCPELKVILANFKKLRDKEMMTQHDIAGFFHHFFTSRDKQCRKKYILEN